MNQYAILNASYNLYKSQNSFTSNSIANLQQIL